MERRDFTKLYMRAVVATGAAVLLVSLFRLRVAQLDLGFFMLAVVTSAIGSRVAIQIPRISGQITVADTLIFLTLLLYGGDAAVLLAAVEGACSSLRISRKPITILYNAAMLAVAMWVTVWTLSFCFGPIVDLPRDGHADTYIFALCLMALVQYVTNSGLAAAAQALKTDQPVWQTWYKYYLWSSITYFAGASAAGITARLVGVIDVYTALIITPIITIIYFTYLIYLKNIEASEAHAEQAERHVEELNRYIAEQERIREQFAQIEKLSALGELASGVAHDFNNTLAAILARAQLMQRRTGDPEIGRGLSIIVKAAEDGAKTVKRIQDFARQRRDHDFALVAVDQLLLDVVEITRPRWKDLSEAENVHITFNAQVHSRALVRGDASELREVLVNMIFNAIDAMPGGGTITLLVEEREGCVEISLSDTGVGMDDDVRSRVFDPFFTTKGTAGLGLGLAVSYGIISRHGGTIDVASEVGRGSTFRINLPTAVSTALTGGNTEASAARLSLVRNQTSRKFLVVDDEDNVRELLGELLRGEGYEVAMAEDGGAALALLDAGEFDAVFTDVGMPGMSGWELAQAIRRRDDRIPIAVITGWGEAVSLDEQKAAGIDWIVSKPFSFDRIAEIAAEIPRRYGSLTRGVA